MPRRTRPPRRETPADARYDNRMVGAFINRLMLGGKKSVAESIVSPELPERIDVVTARRLTAWRPWFIDMPRIAPSSTAGQVNSGSACEAAMYGSCVAP